MPTLCHFETHAASHIPELLCATVTQLLEIECRDVWRELVNYTEGDLTPEIETESSGIFKAAATAGPYMTAPEHCPITGGKNVLDCRVVSVSDCMTAYPACVDLQFVSLRKGI